MNSHGLPSGADVFELYSIGESPHFRSLCVSTQQGLGVLKSLIWAEEGSTWR